LRPQNIFIMSAIQILLGEGLENVKFGMTKSQVNKILGKPDETEVYQFSEDESDLTEAWHYDDAGFSVSFDQENDWLLGSIAVSQTPCVLEGTDVMGMPKATLMSHLDKLEICDVEVDHQEDEEEGLHLEVIYSPDENICFFLEADKVSEVKWSPRWADTEMLDWPADSEN